MFQKDLPTRGLNHSNNNRVVHSTKHNQSKNDYLKSICKYFSTQMVDLVLKVLQRINTKHRSTRFQAIINPLFMNRRIEKNLFI